MADAPDDEELLARDVIDVHGADAAAVARRNARAAALAGQAMRAKSWIRVLGIIQRQQNDKLYQTPRTGQPAALPAGPKL